MLVIRSFFAVLLAMVLFAPGKLMASVILVPRDYPSIQAAIDIANDGDEIVVASGTYQENLRLTGLNFTLRSTEPTSSTVVEQTVIDGSLGDSEPVITLTGTEGSTTTLSGFTITGGTSGETGGGIDGRGTNATIRDNIIRANTADFGGGIAECHGLIQNNDIIENRAYTEGGGLYNCDGVISENRVESNLAQQHDNVDAPCLGGGLSRCDAIIDGNEIIGNRQIGQNWSVYGRPENIRTGGGGLSYCTGTISNNVISSNTANSTNFSAGSGGGLYWVTGNIRNNLIENNTTLPPPNSHDSSGGRGGGAFRLEGIIDSNIFRGNTSGLGAGVDSAFGIVSNSIFLENEATTGGGGLLFGDCIVYNSIIYSNTAGEFHGGISGGGIKLVNTIVWNNEAPLYPQVGPGNNMLAYSCIQDWTGGGEGNTSVKPYFVDPGGGDFRLKSHSLLIDAGKAVDDLNTDFAGNQRPILSTPPGLRGDGSGFDIGAFEYQGQTVNHSRTGWMLY